MKFTGNFEKMGKIMYRRIFVHHINFYRLENNMKLVSWNVNGIRACITKGFEESFAKLDADIFCLQETKCQENQVKLELPGYYQYWNYANRKGYSGTAVFTKKEPLSVTYGLGIEEHDKEGRVITAEMDDFYLVTVYTPNSQSELRRLEYRMEWERDFLAYLLKLQEKKPVICCGDMNVAHQEIDLKNPKTNRMTQASQMKREHALPELWKRDLLIHFATFIRSLRVPTPGGLTDLRQERRMPDGELIISSPLRP